MGYSGRDDGTMRVDSEVVVEEVIVVLLVVPLQND